MRFRFLCNSAHYFFHPGRNFDDPTLRDVVYRCQWEFGDERAAFLVMLRARKITIPPRFLNLALKEEDNPVPEIIKTKNIVTSVWVCPTFGMYLSNRSREHVKIALCKPKAGFGQEEQGSSRWHLEGNVGVHQFGTLPNDGGGDYLPLYKLESIQTQNFVGDDGEEVSEVLWMAPEVPWRRLDEDGFEVGASG